MNDPQPTSPSPAPGAEPPPKAPPGLWRGWVRPFLLVLVGLLVFRSVVLDWNVVPSGSMKPTIVEGDYIFVDKLAYDLKVPFTSQVLLHWGGPRRGDIVVFTPPGETERYVKRVVGVPGDRLELRDNQLFVNGEPARYEPLNAPPQAQANDWLGREVVAGRGHPILLSPDRPGPDSFEPMTVPAGHYFLMGDNRDDSKDSRFFGPVARERIVGRVTRVAISLDPWHHRLPRWGRFLLSLT
jgi:signal peptidase I